MKVINEEIGERRVYKKQCSRLLHGLCSVQWTEGDDGPRRDRDEHEPLVVSKNRFNQARDVPNQGMEAVEVDMFFKQNCMSSR